MPQLAGDIKPASVGKVRFQLLLAGVVLLGVLAAFIFQLMSGHILRATAQQSKITTQQVALRVAAMADYYGSTAALLAKDPDLAYLLMVGNESALQSREESLRYVFPKAINVQLLPPGITAVDKNASPPLSHAALAQMRAAEAAEDEPPIEVHLFNTPQQHINIAHRVVDPAGSVVVGHLMVSLSADVLQNILDDIRELDGYIEVQQDGGKGAPVVIARFGEQSLKRGDADRVVRYRGQSLASGLLAGRHWPGGAGWHQHVGAGRFYSVCRCPGGFDHRPDGQDQQGITRRSGQHGDHYERLPRWPTATCVSFGAGGIA